MVIKIEAYFSDNSITKMRCKALKESLSRCNGSAVKDCVYCTFHSNMTPEIYKERWIQKYLLAKNSNLFLWKHNQGPRTAILSDLESRFVSLTPEDIALIPNKDRSIDLFTLLCLNGYATREMRPDLWLRGATLLIKYIWYNEPTMQSILGEALLYDADSFIVFIENIPLLEYSRSHPHFERFMLTLSMFLTKCLKFDMISDFCWREPCYLSIVEIYENELKDNTLVKYMKESWIPALKEIRLNEKRIQKAKMLHCKEDLMAAAWHPKRVEHYLDVGGFKLLDNMCGYDD